MTSEDGSFPQKDRFEKELTEGLCGDLDGGPDVPPKQSVELSEGDLPTVGSTQHGEQETESFRLGGALEATQPVEPAGTTNPEAFHGGEPPEQFGRYRLRGRLGKGGMGEVFIAEDVELGRTVALKLPLKRDSGSGESHARFLREAKSAASLDHRSICPIYDFGEIAGQPFLAMAYVEGSSLADRLKERPALSIYEAVEIINQLAKALQYAHENGVVHRDIKPQNVVIDRRGRPVILDFGLARIRHEGDASLTQTGTVLGTPAYMSPEQADGQSRAVGPASDIYSLGVMLYEMISGRRPFTGSPTEVIGMHLFVQPDKPSRHNKQIDSILDEICLKMLQKKAIDRYSSMREISHQLEQWLEGKRDLALLSTSSEQLGWWLPLSFLIAAAAMVYFAWFFSYDQLNDPIDGLINLVFTAPCLLVSAVMFSIAIWWIIRNVQLRRAMRTSSRRRDT